MKDGFISVAVATPEVEVANCVKNAAATVQLVEEAAARGVKLLVLPELGLTAYTCGDLFLQDSLLRGAEQALTRVLDASARHAIVLVVGMPFRLGGALYNVAAVICRGKLLGLVPKHNIPNYSEFYEARHFTSGRGIQPMTVQVCGQETLFGDGLLFRCTGLSSFVLGCEICEDLWVANPPSSYLSAAGATVIANPSASDETIGKAAYRRELVKGQSARLLCGYVYADAGMGESTQDLVFSGHDLHRVFRTGFGPSAP